MADGFERDDHEHEGGGGSFMMGLLTGTVLGAGLGMLLAPKSGTELRSKLGEQASSLGRAAGGQLRRAGDVAGGIMEKTRESATRAAEDLRGRAEEAARSAGSGMGTSTGTPGAGSMGSGSTYTGGSSTPETSTGGSTYTGEPFPRDRDRG